MATVLVVVLGASALAFFICFFVALCTDRKRPQIFGDGEVVRVAAKQEDGLSTTEQRRSA
jgi:hypothetical protein